MYNEKYKYIYIYIYEIYICIYIYIIQMYRAKIFILKLNEYVYVNQKLKNVSSFYFLSQLKCSHWSNVQSIRTKRQAHGR